jgi:hypothetical protein
LKRKKTGDDDSADSHRTTKTTKSTKTNKDNKSRSSKALLRRKSFISSKSGKSRRSSRSGRSGVESDQELPHNKVIGKVFLKGMKKNNTYIEKLSINEFQNIPFEYGGFSNFAIDLFHYITLFRIDEHFENLKVINEE